MIVGELVVFIMMLFGLGCLILGCVQTHRYSKKEDGYGLFLSLILCGIGLFMFSICLVIFLDIINFDELIAQWWNTEL